MFSLWLCFLGPSALTRAMCTSRADLLDGLVAWEMLQREAAIRIQSATRRSLSLMVAARKRADWFRDILWGRVPSICSDESYGAPRQLWVAYSACSHQDADLDFVGPFVTYQEYVGEKLSLHDMPAPDECFRVRGEGLLPALHCASRLTLEQLMCIGC